MTALTELVGSLSSGYLISQALTIFMLYLVGFLYVTVLWRGEDPCGIWKILLSFPSGLAVFAVSSYLMLCIGIPYNTYSSAGVLIVTALASVFAGVREKSYVNIIFDKTRLSILIFATAVAAALCFMLTSNLFAVVLDNDSFYYFSTYPEAIVREGRYIRYFDVFLTDAAPIGSIIQTLPYLFGFSETFGIQYILDADFLLIFAYALYTELSRSMEKKKAIFCSLTALLFLLTSSAWLITAKWIMAGVYFMSYYFITSWICYRASFSVSKPYVLMSLFAVMIAMMRQEGVILTVILILTLSFLEGYSGKELVYYLLFPVTAAAALYYIRVFAILGVHPLYAFLTPLKAVVMILALIFSGIYLLFIKNRLKGSVRKLLPVLLPALLFLVNIGLMAFRPSDYLGNLKMFYLNVRIGAGWGYFGYIAGCIVFILFIRAVVYKEWYLLYYDSLMISYILGVLIVSFGRGDALRKGVGDSGNRVMLTAVPIIVFSIVLRYFSQKTEVDNYDSKG